jgi:MFS family permease
LNSAILAITIDGGISSVIFNLFILRLGHGPEGVGTINAIATAAFALACVPIGRLGNSLGLLRVMRAGIALALLGTLLTPMAGWLPFGLQVPALVLSVVLTNIGIAGYFVISAPYVGLLSTPEQRPAVFSGQSTAFAVFGFIGGILGGVIPSLLSVVLARTLDQPEPFLWTLFLIPMFMFLTLMVMRRMQPVDPDAEQPRAAQPSAAVQAAAPVIASGSALLGVLAFFGLLRFLQVGGVAATQTFFNVYMDRELNVSTATIGIILAVAKLLGVPAALAIPWLTRKFGSAGTVAGALTFAAVGMLPLAFVRLPEAAALGYVMVWLSTPVRYGAFMVYILARTPSRMHATLNGTQEALAGVAFAATALVGGFSVERLGYSFVFLMGALAMLLGAILLGAHALRNRSPKPQSSAHN